MPKERESKIKWEKDRRLRLNEAFSNLGKLLPCFDPSIKLSKIVIIENAITTIKDLDEKLKKFLSSESDKDDAKGEIIKKFEARINKLHLRNGFLSKILKDAGIKVPLGYGPIKKRLPKLSNKITPQQAKLLQENADLEKENVASRSKAPRQKKTKSNETSPLRKTLVDTLKNKKVTLKTRRKLSQVPNQKCLIILSQSVPVNNPYYIIAKNSKKKITPTVLTNSTLLKAPLATPTIKPSIFSNTPVQGLGPGTLVLPNGAIIPINQTPQAIPAPTIIASPIQNNSSAVIIVSKYSTTNTSNKIVVSQAQPLPQNIIYRKPLSRKDSLPKLKPKSWLTQTTQVIKLPIPALTSKYNSTQHSKLNIVDKRKCTAKETKVVKEKVQDSSQNKRKSELKAENNIKRPKNDTSLNVRNDNSINVSTSLCDTTTKSSPAAFVTSSETKANDQDNTTKEILEDPLFSSVSVDNETKQQTLAPSNEDASSASLPTSKPNSVINQIDDLRDKDHSKTGSIDEITSEASVQQEILQSDPIPNLCNTQISEVQESTNIGNLEHEKLNADLPVIETGNIEIPTTQNESQGIKNMELNLSHSDLSNDIFASLQVPPGCQNPESTSPTAAFLLAFPLVSTGAKVAEVIDGENNSESQTETPNLLQIGALDSTKSKQANAESLTPSLLNIDNFSFFSSKEICGSFYNSYSSLATSTTNNSNTISTMKNVLPNLSQCERHTEGPELVHDRKLESVGMKTPFDNEKIKTSKKELVLNNPGDQFSNYETKKNTGVVPISNNNTNSNIPNQFPANYNSIKNQREVDFARRIQSNSESVSNYDNITSESQKLPTQYTIAKDQNICNTSQSLINFQNSGIGNHSLNTNSNIDNISNFNNFLLPTNLNNTKNKGSIMPNPKQKDLYLNKSYDYSSNYNNQKIICSYTTTSSVEPTKNYNSFYSNANNCSYNYHSDLNFANNYFKSVPSNEVKSDYMSYDNCSDYRKPESNLINNYCTNIQPTNKNTFSNNQAKVKHVVQQNKPINWMTGDNSANCKFDYFVPPLSKENDYGHNMYYNSFGGTSVSNTTYFSTPSIHTSTDHSSSMISDIKKNMDLPLTQFNYNQKTEAEENQFSWSPSKIPQFLDHSHSFVSSSLPTLVGDLALNNSQYPEPKIVKDRNKEAATKILNYDSQINQSNFLSVSQLVEQNKDPVPAKNVTRRNSNGRAKNITLKSKRTNKQETKDAQNYHESRCKSNKNHQIKNSGNCNMIDSFDQKQQGKDASKNVPSSYSAESLIGHQIQSNANKTSVSSFLTENIISYIPPMDSQVSQTNCYIQQNQNYQTSSFPHNLPSSFQNNSYTTKSFIPSASTLTTTYLPTSGFMHDTNVPEFYTESFNMFQNNVGPKDKSYKECTKQPAKIDKIQNTNCKKVKKRNPNDNVLPTFDIPFLSMPGNINSPILPDDFHHTTFLPPTTPYPCKNPLYPKQTTELSGSALLPPFPSMTGSKSSVPHPDSSISANTGGTSLTNFNLSTIFPEINKGPLPSGYSDPRGKEQSRNFAIQESFSSKPFSFNSYNTS